MCGSMSGACTMSLPKWLDPKISLGNILTIATALVAIVAGWVEVKADNRRQDTELAALRRADDELKLSVKEAATGLRSDILEIKTRSDLILEKLVEKQQSTTERVVRVETKIDEVLKAVIAQKRM